MAARFFRIGEVCARHSESFGTFPIHMTEAGRSEPVFSGLSNPFWGADFRHFQVIQPDFDRLEELGASILAIEKARPHVPWERAMMGIRFSSEMVGVQFHPEADADGMLDHFQQEQRRQFIIEEHGEDKYDQMISDLSDSNKIAKTNETILPNFLRNALEKLLKNLPAAALV